MKTTIYEKYLECYISQDEFYTNGICYGNGVGIDPKSERRGYYFYSSLLNLGGRENYLYNGNGYGYLNGSGDDNIGQNIIMASNMPDDFFIAYIY